MIWHHYQLARASALLGRSREALAYLGMAVGEGYKDYWIMKYDSDLESLQKDPGFTMLLEQVQARYPNILRKHAEYAPTSSASRPCFIYQASSDADLAAFRDTWKLEDVAGKGDDSARLINILHWVHTQVRHDGSSKNPWPFNAMNLIEVSRKEKRGVNCRMMATILNEACLALGYKARHITCLPLDEKDTECHVVTVVWLDSLKKWVFLDPTSRSLFHRFQGRSAIHS